VPCPPSWSAEWPEAPPDRASASAPVPTFVLSHEHRPDECRVAFAAWKGFSSPVRGTRVLCSCATGGHRLWWVVTAADASAALAQLPPFVASRSTAEPVREAPIP
jgi:hypothetical protein